MASSRYRSLNFSRSCCNPFNSHKTSCKYDLRPVLDWMLKKVPTIQKDQVICSTCRKAIAKRPENTVNDPEVTLEADSEFEADSPILEDTNENQREKQDVDVNLTEPREIVSALNKTLESIDESPINIKKLRHQLRYPKTKYHKVNKAVKRKVFNLEDESDTEYEILSQLKEKFKIAKRNEKIQILTILPKSWSISKIENEFGASNYMVRKAKKLVDEQGILSSPNLKPGKVLSFDTAKIVKEFYLSEEISRIMPGRKDYVSVNIDGKKVLLQKHLILFNLREAYINFKKHYPENIVGFSKFAELRPKNCVLAGGSGTHAVCVCTIHQNVKLMIAGAKLYDLTNGSIKTYKDCLSKIICNEPSKNCYLGNCEICPGSETLITDIAHKLEENYIDYITYRQWMYTDRSTLEIVVKSSSEFLESFSEKLTNLLKHSFIARKQSDFYKELKLKLRFNEIAVICDFSENYSFVIQDEVQSFHWNNVQATLHPFVIYYSKDNNIEHTSFVVISDCLKHDTVAVHLFQRKLIRFLSSSMFKNITKIYYFSDGAASQYKNKKFFINLCYHKEEFGIDAEWHYFATSHGKSACDGVGGTVKRLARKASLQSPFENQIIAPKELYDWAIINIPSVTFEYCTIREHNNEMMELEERFLKAKTLVGTRKIHSVIPIANTKIQTKVFSAEKTYKIEDITRSNLKD